MVRLGIPTVTVLLLHLFVASLWIVDATDIEASTWSDIRLPDTIAPIEYDIFLHPNLTDGRFLYTGSVSILLEVRKPTSFIVLHSFQLHHLLTKLTEFDPDQKMVFPMDDKKDVPIKGTQFNSTNQQAIILLGSQLSTEKNYLLTIIFSGELRAVLNGFYRSSYKTKEGETRFIASTQFEATGARLAFPCFDEPALKARFRIYMVREKIHTALSNMPIERQYVRPDGLIVDHFQESVKMSSYLVAFIVCDFERVTSMSRRGIVVNVWAPKDQISQAKYAIEIAPKILDYYEVFFNVDFPLPKQDLIAIPDFGAGAMENWGLITYRLTALLYDERESSAANKQRVGEVIAHEMAHQWFGNLVTMKWWNDLWLNEGFAAFVQSVGSAYISPEWKMDEQFVTQNVQSAMVADGHLKSHPISVEVRNPAEIGALFDLISYQKGSSIIRMMQDFLGQENMIHGLTKYLEKYKYSNAASDDLWNELSKEAEKGVNVKKIMHTWTKQMGYPVVTVIRDGENAHLMQERFISDSKSVSNSSWDIPITYYFQKAHDNQRKWFMQEHKNGIRIPWKSSMGWIKLNVDQVGFYRVNYDIENWKSLSKQLTEYHKIFSSTDRSNLIDDAFQLANVGRLNYVQALEMTEYLTKEKEYVPFFTAARSLEFIGSMLSGDGYTAYEKYIVEKILPSVKRLGWKDSGSHLDKFLRGMVLKLAVEHNYVYAVQRAKSMFKEWMENGKVVPANLRAIVYYAGIKYGGAREWNFMFDRYMRCLYPSEKKLLMYSLTYTTRPELLSALLEMALIERYVRTADAHMLIAQIAHNSAGRQLTYQFLLKKWDTLIHMYRTAMNALNSILEAVFASGNTKQDYEKAKEFFASHELEAGDISRDQILGTIRGRILWVENYEKTVVNWLNKEL